MDASPKVAGPLDIKFRAVASRRTRQCVIFRNPILHHVSLFDVRIPYRNVQFSNDFHSYASLQTVALAAEMRAELSSVHGRTSRQRRDADDRNARNARNYKVFEAF